MSRLRRSETESGWGVPKIPDAKALKQILASVRKRKGLIHGRINLQGKEHCALGAFFADHGRVAISTALGNEVAAVNDAMPKGTSTKKRRELVMNWLRLRLKTIDKEAM